MAQAEIRNPWHGKAEEILLYPVPSIRIALAKDAGGAVVTKVSTLHRDALGSVRAVTNAAGLKAERSLFRPFGEETSTRFDLSVAMETKGFIGQRLDADAGLQYLNARYYDPKLAMFLQPDWWEVTKAGVGTNRYGYSGNDPVNGKDPSGHLVVNIGGALDKGNGPKSNVANFFERIFSKVFPDRTKSPNGLSPIGGNFKDIRRIEAQIVATKAKYPNEPIVVIGHSRGANGAVKLVNRLSESKVRVDFLLTLDPVALDNVSMKEKAKPKTWINIYVPEESRVVGKDPRVPINPDWIAEIGGPIAPYPDAKNVAMADWVGRSTGVHGHMAVVGYGSDYRLDTSSTVVEILKSLGER